MNTEERLESGLSKKELEKMPVFYDLRKDIRFKEGLKKGLEEGEKQGLEKGKLRKAHLITIRLLKRGVLSAAIIAEDLDVPLDFVQIGRAHV